MSVFPPPPREPLWRRVLVAVWTDPLLFVLGVLFAGTLSAVGLQMWGSR